MSAFSCGSVDPQPDFRFFQDTEEYLSNMSADIDQCFRVKAALSLLIILI